MRYGIWAQVTVRYCVTAGPATARLKTLWAERGEVCEESFEVIGARKTFGARLSMDATGTHRAAQGMVHVVLYC